MSAFRLDTFPRLTGAKSHIFQPPHTPSASASASSSIYLTQSMGSLISDNTNDGLSSNVGRKRNHADYASESYATPVASGEEWGMNSMNSMGMELDSPIPFVNTRYRLAGGMDTPTLAEAAAVERDLHGSEYADGRYRTELGGREAFTEHISGDMLDGIPREGNGRSRMPVMRQQSSEGWSKLALNIVGGVVGKVWEFCKTSAFPFRGFHAGGGRGYNVKPSESEMTATPTDSFWESEKLPGFPNIGTFDREATVVPDMFSGGGLTNDYVHRHDNSLEDSPPRPAKRRQVSNPTDELAKNWVVVPESVESPKPTPASRFPPPRPVPSSRYSVLTSSGRRSTPGRPVSRPNSAISISVGTRRVGLTSRGSHAGSPALQSYRGASFAPSRSPTTLGRSRSSTLTTPSLRSATTAGAVAAAGINGEPGSPASVEAQKWAAMKRKQEREADESIRRLDAQLKAMIREGKEALGTKIEVEMDDDDAFDDNDKKWDF
ncbi:hypothetical protein F5884DRAFT_754482 [Xylogone sp. PMI_703]|nr:hypothetical protein F5884DRAFT_754482 [Xylogone sp. PMI_703]